MCGEQYYKVSVPSGQTCDLTWTLSPGSGDYDLYTKWEGSCPTTGAYDCRSANGGTTADTCSKTTLAAGTYYALSHIYTSGKYSIQASLSNCQNVCSSLNYPTDKWQRVWYDISNNCLGNGPDGPNEEFSNDWGSGVLAYTRSDNIMFYSSKTIYFSSAGSYKFILGSDDGSELFIDGVSKINLWSDHGYTEKSTIMSLTAGNHQFRINYYERTGGAILSFDILISGVDLDCYNECTRRGYATGDCYKRNDFIEYHQCKETYSDYDAVGSYGSCSPNSIYNCECCHNCPTTPVNDSVSVGSCTLSITGTGNDATYPSYVPGFLLFNKDTNWRSYRMDEDRSDLGWCGNRVCGGIFHCYTGLGAKQSWTITGDQITIKTDTLSKDTSDDLGAGFNFNSGCKFTSVSANASTPELLLQTGTDSQQGSCLTGTKFYGIRRSAYASGYTQWTLDIEYCGDGECNCGETCTSCVGDCGSCDTTPPTTSISVKRKSTGLPPTESWLRADTYTIQFTDNDNVGGSGLRNCHYYINSCNANGSNCITPVVSDRTRPCGTPIDIPLGTSPYTLEGIRYLIYSYVYDNAGNRSTPDASVVLKTDFTPPGTEIR